MKNKILSKSIKVLKYLAIYYLSIKMIAFAIPKLLHMQFRILHYEAFVPLAEISKYDHMWSFFGRSYNYNLFIGLTEFLIGALIIFKRTRLIALIISLGVCLNILILNIEFDIHFALQHIILDLILTILLLIGYRKDLYKFFIELGGRLKGGVKKPQKRWVTLLPVFYLIIFSVGYFAYAYKLKSGVDNKLAGSYQIKKTLLEESPVQFRNGKLGSAPMLFFEYNNQAVLSVNDSLFFGHYAIDKDNLRIYFKPSNLHPLHSINARFRNNSLIEGHINDSISLEIEIEKLPEERDYLNELYAK